MREILKVQEISEGSYPKNMKDNNAVISIWNTSS